LVLPVARNRVWLVKLSGGKNPPGRTG